MKLTAVREEYFLSSWGLFFKLFVFAFGILSCLVFLGVWNADGSQWGIERALYAIASGGAVLFLGTDLFRAFPCWIYIHRRPMLVVTEGEFDHMNFVVPRSAVKSAMVPIIRGGRSPSIILSVDDSRPWAKTWVRRHLNFKGLSMNWSQLTPGKSAEEWEAIFNGR